MKKPTSEAERREERLAAALRANLARRKQQARERKSLDKSEPEEKPEAGDAQMPQQREA